MHHKAEDVHFVPSNIINRMRTDFFSTHFSLSWKIAEISSESAKTSCNKHFKLSNHFPLIVDISTFAAFYRLIFCGLRILIDILVTKSVSFNLTSRPTYSQYSLTESHTGTQHQHIKAKTGPRNLICKTYCLASTLLCRVINILSC